MRQQIRRISVHQTSKVVAVLYAVAGLLFLPLVWMMSTFGGETDFGLGDRVGILLLPVMYGVFGYLFTALLCVIYNALAGVLGGIELELVEPPREV